MSHKSNGRAVGGTKTDPRPSRHRALNPPPPPAESAIKTRPIELRTKRTFFGGVFDGWIDLERCHFVCSRPGDGFDSDWESLYVTSSGRFLVQYSIAYDNPKDEDHQAWSYAVFISDRQAGEWYADDPGSAPECMRRVIEKLDRTASPAAPLGIVSATPSEGSNMGRTVRSGPMPEPSGNGSAAANGRETETPSWDKETMMLSYKGKVTWFDKKARTVRKVFDWFQDAGWPVTVKIRDYDELEQGPQISNLVNRAKAKALRVGFTIERNRDELKWADKRTQ